MSRNQLHSSPTSSSGNVVDSAAAVDILDDDEDAGAPPPLRSRQDTASRSNATRRKTWAASVKKDGQLAQTMQSGTSFTLPPRMNPDGTVRSVSEGFLRTPATRSAIYISEDEDFTDDDDDEDHIYENPQDLVAEVARREKERHQIMQEILNTELAYVTKLDFIKKIKNQLEALNSVKFIVPPEDVEKMFPCIDALHQLHSLYFVPAFKSALQKWTEHSSIGSIFLAHATQLKVYERFINASPRASKTFRMWTEKEQKFAKLIQMFQQNVATNQLNLLDIFHEPYIKLQRWKLLLQRYSKMIPDRNKDLVDIPNAINLLEDILQQCEKAREEADNLDALLGLEQQIDGLIVFLSSDTKFLKDGPVVEIDPRSQNIGLRAFKRHETSWHLFLFNSFLLICTPKQTNKKHTVCSKLMLSSVKLIPGECLRSMGYSVDRCFILQTTKKALNLMFGSAAEKEEWQSLMQKARRASRQRMTIKRTESPNCANFTLAPVWLPDDCTTCCMLCCQDFTVLSRWRHHCRGCGIIICSKCCPDKIKLPYNSMKLDIVCVNCYNRARKVYPALTATGKTATDDSPANSLDEIEDSIVDLSLHRQGSVDKTEA